MTSDCGPDHRCEWWHRHRDASTEADDARAEAAELRAENAALRRRLESADTHLRLRTAALHRVIARERRQSAIVIGTTAYFPGRVRQIVERYHRWSQG